MARLLIVDDDQALLFVIGEHLAAHGFELDFASSAAQARHCLERSEYDAVLSDYNMPGESGLDLLGHISARYPGLPFILMTGSGMLEDKVMKMGSSGYVAKPFQIMDLVGTIEAVLSFSNRQGRALASTG